MLTEELIGLSRLILARLCSQGVGKSLRPRSYGNSALNSRVCVSQTQATQTVKPNSVIRINIELVS